MTMVSEIFRSPGNPGQLPRIPIRREGPDNF